MGGYLADKDLAAYVSAVNHYPNVHSWAVHLARWYPLTEILKGQKPSFSASIRIPPKPVFWNPGFWLLIYLCACLLACAIQTVTLFVVFFDEEDFRPSRDVEWKRFSALLAILAVAPVSLLTLAIFGLIKLIMACRSGAVRLSGLWRGLKSAAADWYLRSRVAAYRLHILRRLPAPVLQPLELTPATATAAPSAPEPPPAEPEVGAPEEEEEESEEPAWYVIDPDLLFGRRHLLKAAGIEVYPITVHSPSRMDGLAVQPADLERLEQALGLPPGSRSLTETDIERSVVCGYIRPVGSVATFEVEDEGVCGTLERLLEKVSARLGGIDLEFIEMRGRGQQPPIARDGLVKVFHFSLPLGFEDAPNRHLESAFGFPADDPPRRLMAYMPLPDTGAVIADADGRELAQVADGSVYILCDLLKPWRPWSAEVLARLIDEAVPTALAQLSDDDLKAKGWQSELARHRQRYVEMSCRKLGQRRRELEKKIGQCDQNVHDCGRQIAQSIRGKHSAEVELKELLTVGMEDERTRLEREFDALASAKPVLQVTAKEDCITVDTRTVFIRHEGRRYRIGRLRISLFADGNIRFKNLDRPSDRNAHPHVNADGVGCFGNASEAIYRLMGQREYAAVIGLIFRWAENFNPRSPYADVRRWPEAEE